MVYESSYSDSISMPDVHKTGTSPGERKLALYVEGDNSISEKKKFFSDIFAYFITKKDLEVYLREAYEEYHNRTRLCIAGFDYKKQYEENLKLLKDLTSNIILLHYSASERNKGTQLYLNLESNTDLKNFQMYLWPILIPNQQTPKMVFTKFLLNKVSVKDKNYIYMKPEYKKEYNIDELVAIFNNYNSSGTSIEFSLHKFLLRMCAFIKDENILSEICGKANINEYFNKAKELFHICKDLMNEKVDLDLSELSLPCESQNLNDKKDLYQRVYYGAPGTGKSNEIKKLTGEGLDGIKFSKNFTFRITFHPDSDYSSFVGAYKPYWNKALGKIVYDFRPQTFLKAYIAAWCNPTENVALVIEEINRGNCAQVFGDTFQLLDRENNGLSKYPIEADVDMQDFLQRAFDGELTEQLPFAVNISEVSDAEVDDYYANHYDEAFKKIKNGEILSLPRNLSILATMNTSDQSLFPMDSAFKRRWEWIYQPIVDGQKGWKIRLDDEYELIDWWQFLQRINRVISDITTSEDKQLGYFFCLPDEYEQGLTDEDKKAKGKTVISAKLFVGKVIFYLWNDVFKDYAFDVDCCKDDKSKEVLYAQFYNADGNAINTSVLKKFFDSLKNLEGKDDDPLVVRKEGEAGSNGDNSDSETTTSAKFALNGEQMSLKDIVYTIVKNYADNHQSATAQEIRDTFENARIQGCTCIVATEEEYNARSGQSSLERAFKVLPLTEGKVYVNTQWRAGKEDDNFYKFIEVVESNNWGSISKVD